MAQPGTLIESEASTIPLLEQGDHLTRDEFERRYNAMPELKKAELIEGVVYMASPVRLPQHGQPHGIVMGWLSVYWGFTPGLFFGDNVSIRLIGDEMPQPDALLMIKQANGGQASLGADGCIEDAPEFVVEVASSTASIDLNAKFRAYQRNGVREYMVWRVLDRAIDWFVLRDGKYHRLEPGADGIYRSVVFPGLWLDVEALLAENFPRILEVLHQGIAHTDHTAFVARLNPTA
jgi:Uma2 family endonuclease